MEYSIKNILSMRIIYSLLLTSTLLVSCVNHSGVDKTLSLAGENRAELEKVLKHYKMSGECKKYRAACFLIDNMKYHGSYGKIEYLDNRIDSLAREADVAYYSEIKGLSHKEILSDDIKRKMDKAGKEYCKKLGKLSYDSVKYSNRFHPDYKEIDSKFLIEHIDHAFKMWETSLYAKNLSFDEFCEYLLPYRAIPGYRHLNNNVECYSWFGKYFTNVGCDSIEDYLKLYHTTMLNTHRYLGNFKYEYTINPGICGVFYENTRDCYDMASICAEIFRSIGIPTYVAVNLAYQDLNGRHVFCASMDKDGSWKFYDPEWLFEGTNEEYIKKKRYMNIHRFSFSLPENSVFADCKQGSLIPNTLKQLYNDVSSDATSVVEYDIEYNGSEDYPVAYLASFSSTGALIPVTWGKKSGKSYTFDNVMLDRLYFPVTYNGGRITPFSSPFMLKKDISQRKGYRHITYTSTDNKMVDGICKRKYPVKLSTKEYIKKMRGIHVIASDNYDYSDCDTLAVIDFLPEPQLQDLTLKCDRPYKYYRIQTGNHDWLHLSEVYFLAPRSYGYSNSLPTPELPILPNVVYNDTIEYVRFRDVPEDEFLCRAENDGNMQTISATSCVDLRFNEQRYMTKVRFAPLNAENNIFPENKYVLYKWSGTSWEKIAQKKANAHFLCFENVLVGSLYWLKNITTGQEESPFVFNEDGKQCFVNE